jgi:hypothetical protein
MVYLFVSVGFFFGGTVDHIIFVMRGTPAPYGVELGLTGNLLMALFDLVIGIVLFLLFRKNAFKREIAPNKM